MQPLSHQQARWPRLLFEAEDATVSEAYTSYGNVISQDTMAFVKGFAPNVTDAARSAANNSSAGYSLLHQSARADHSLTLQTPVVDEGQLASGENLFAEFHQVCSELDGAAGAGGALELCRQLADLCDYQDAALKRLGLRLASPQRRALWWERQTWHLIGMLYRDRLSAASGGEPMLEDSADDEEEYDIAMTDDAGDPDARPRHRRPSRRQAAAAAAPPEKRLVAHLYATDTQLREAQLLVDWLEAGAAARLDESPAPPDACEAATGGVSWEHTLHLMKRAAASGAALPAGLVTRLDPDAPVASAAARQQQLQICLLADLDRAEEERLFVAAFQLVRSGQLQRAARLFASAGQHWRAAGLYGWQLPGNPCGNARRDLWRCAAWTASTDSCLGRWERALLAGLCGNLDPLLAVCHGWEDRLWAYARCFVEARVHACLRDLSTAAASSLPANPGMPETAQLVARRLASLESVLGQLGDAGSEFWPSVQAAVILDRTAGLPNLLASRLAEGQLDGQELRFGVHLTLCLRWLGLLPAEEAEGAGLLQSYLDRLIGEGKIDLVAYYTARLPRSQQVSWYGKLLQRVEDTPGRMRCLQLAERHGLDTAAITVAVVELVRKSSLDEADSAAAASASEQLSEAERRKVGALDWVFLGGATPRVEAVRQACALARLFLALGKEAGARESLAKVPEDSARMVEAEECGGGQLSSVARDSLRELACLRAYLTAQETVADWTVHFYQARPERPDPAPPNAPYTEKLLHEQRERRYQAELERWRHLLSLHTRAAVARLEDLLLWPAPGWLADEFPAQSEAAEPGRGAQLQSLRRLYLPQLCLCVARLMLQAEQPRGLVRLAELVAGDLPGRVYGVFRQDQLQQLFMLLRDAACRLLDEGLDAFGYEMDTVEQE